MDFLRGRIADLGLRCGFRERQTVYLPGNVLNVTELKREAATRAEVGLRSRFIDADALRAMTGIERRGAILSSGAGEVDPAALVAGLWRSALERGARIYAPTEVTDVVPGDARQPGDGGRTRGPRQARRVCDRLRSHEAHQAPAATG